MIGTSETARRRRPTVFVNSSDYRITLYNAITRRWHDGKRARYGVARGVLLLLGPAAAIGFIRLMNRFERARPGNRQL